MQTIADAGLDQAVLPEIQSELLEHQKIYHSLTYGSAASSEIDLSVLDELLQDDVEADAEEEGAHDSDAESESDGSEASTELNDIVAADSIADEAARAVSTENAVDSEQVHALRLKYGFVPTTPYDEAKNKHFEQMEAYSWTTATSEEDFEVITAQR